ncbi:MAG: hypothetical protein MI742_16320 [Desulfobacterales bacterium]|nr:hypothetical protein [Desulfobacterales bacterium]
MADREAYTIERRERAAERVVAIFTARIPLRSVGGVTSSEYTITVYCGGNVEK